MNDPTPKTILCLFVVLGLSYFFLKPTFFLAALVVDGVCMLLNARFRDWLPSAIRLLMAWLALLCLVTMTRIWGVGHNAKVFLDALRATKLIMMMFFSIGIFYLYVSPWDYLAAFDRLRLPRSLSYVLLSTGTLLGFMRSVGERQYRFLELKGLTSNGFVGMVRAYYRIVAPMFILSLMRQMTHARSLDSRGFFSGFYYKDQKTAHSCAQNEMVLVAIFLFNSLIWIGMQLWIS